ncbi:metallophosphoesterase [Methanomethylovorans sp.]|uniref:metallophosphoesterase n=1 Tax=Methanomethylovorans sp. TaxID=2758717 RepID=UPI00351C333B
MDREIKIIHTADTHIGYRQYHSDVRRQDFLQAFSTVIDDAIKMQSDAVVHAGDLFDSRTPSLEDILDTMKLFSRLKEADIPLLAIVGNHESKQSTQWLDLFESMGLAIRLGTVPYMLENIAFYGIDSVPRSKIPLYDFSVFEEPLASSYNVLVMHQLMGPITVSEWDCASVIGSVPFHVDVMLLGDYHKYEKITVGDTWVTYCGSTERNSLAEEENRSYNIITISEKGIDISRRNILTREFLRIPVTIRDPGKVYEDILSAVKEHDVNSKVVFVEISGDANVSISHAEIEEMLLSRNVLVPGVRDLRKVNEDGLELSVSISFYDPDEAIKNEIKNMHLSTGGLLVDEIVRDLDLPKTKVSDEAENRLGALLQVMDFSKPITLTPLHEQISLISAGIENEPALSSSPEADVIKETERSVIDVPEVKVSEPEKEPDTAGSEKQDEKHDEKKQKAPAHAKPKQYNLGDYF